MGGLRGRGNALSDKIWVILADQVKSLDWQMRKAEKKGMVAKMVQEEVADNIRAILEG